MAKQVQLRRGSTIDHDNFTGAGGEVTVDTDKNTLVVHDGFTQGGFPLATAIDPTLTGTINIANPGSYIQFPDGTQQYSAYSLQFYMVMPDTLFTPLVGTNRYYPESEIMITAIKYNLGLASTSPVSLDLLIDGYINSSFTIGANVNNGSFNTSIIVSLGSYVTINVNSGSASDVTLRFLYTT
jgi:hypothetical protein